MDGYGVGIRIPLCVERLISRVSTADHRNRSTGEATIRIPAIKCIALTGYIVLCRQGRACAVGIAGYVFPAGNGAAVCMERHRINAWFPYRIDGFFGVPILVKLDRIVCFVNSGGSIH